MNYISVAIELIGDVCFRSLRRQPVSTSNSYRNAALCQGFRASPLKIFIFLLKGQSCISASRLSRRILIGFRFNDVFPEILLRNTTLDPSAELTLPACTVPSEYAAWLHGLRCTRISAHRMIDRTTGDLKSAVPQTGDRYS